MSSTVPFSAVTRMLSDCAPGSDYRLATHSYVVKYNGRVYPSLPKHDNLEIGYIRKLVRNLQINLDCANKHFPGLIKVAKEPQSEEQAKKAAAPTSKPN